MVNTFDITNKIVMNNIYNICSKPCDKITGYKYNKYHIPTFNITH